MKIIPISMISGTAWMVLFYVLMVTAPSAWSAGAVTAATPEASVEVAPTLEDTSDHWKFDVSTFAWFPDTFTMHTDTEVGTFSQRLGLKHLLKMYRGGGMIHFTAHKRKFGFFADLTYGDIADSSAAIYSPVPLSENYPVKSGIQCGILQLGGSYRFGTDRFSFDSLAGVRYMHVKTHFAISKVGVNSQKHFIEPMLGGKLKLGLSETWTLSTQMSVSGFGLGSDLTTDSEARISYKLSNKVTCYFGYRILNTKYHQKAGNLAKLAIWNTQIPSFMYKDIDVTVECMLQGPLAGIELRW